MNASIIFNYFLISLTPYVPFLNIFLRITRRKFSAFPSRLYWDSFHHHLHIFTFLLWHLRSFFTRPFFLKSLAFSSGSYWECRSHIQLCRILTENFLTTSLKKNLTPSYICSSFTSPRIPHKTSFFSIIYFFIYLTRSEPFLNVFVNRWKENSQLFSIFVLGIHHFAPTQTPHKCSTFLIPIRLLSASCSIYTMPAESFLLFFLFIIS